MNKPIVGITMGDPAGSGPEITIKALADPEQYSYCRPIVVGDVKVMEQAKKFVGREDIVIHRCDKVSDALFTPGTISCGGSPTSSSSRPAASSAGSS